MQSNTIDGTTLSNGATISTTTTEDAIYSNSSSQNIQVPYPDPYTTTTVTNSVLPGEDIDITIRYANDSRTCTKSGVEQILPSIVVAQESGLSGMQLALMPLQLYLVAIHIMIVLFQLIMMEME